MLVKILYTGEQVISVETCKITLAIMATCGLYDETGHIWYEQACLQKVEFLVILLR